MIKERLCAKEGVKTVKCDVDGDGCYSDAYILCASGVEIWEAMEVMTSIQGILG